MLHIARLLDVPDVLVDYGLDFLPGVFSYSDFAAECKRFLKYVVCVCILTLLCYVYMLFDVCVNLGRALSARFVGRQLPGP